MFKGPSFRDVLLQIVESGPSRAHHRRRSRRSTVAAARHGANAVSAAAGGLRKSTKRWFHGDFHGDFMEKWSDWLIEFKTAWWFLELTPLNKIRVRQLGWSHNPSMFQSPPQRKLRRAQDRGPSTKMGGRWTAPRNLGDLLWKSDPRVHGEMTGARQIRIMLKSTDFRVNFAANL